MFFEGSLFILASFCSVNKRHIGVLGEEQGLSWSFKLEGKTKNKLWRNGAQSIEMDSEDDCQKTVCMISENKGLHCEFLPEYSSTSKYNKYYLKNLDPHCLM